MKCKLCGHTLLADTPPERCPNCGAPSSAFEKLEGAELAELEKAAAEMPRRQFLSVLGWLGAIVSCVISLFAWIKYIFPNVLFEGPSVFKIGHPDEIENGKFIEEARAYIFRDENKFRAITAVCTHLGCTVKWVDDKSRFVDKKWLNSHRNMPRWEFHCPCHGSKYHSNGEPFAGPAPRKLKWLRLKLAEDGQLMVNTKDFVKMDSFLEV